jgi:hypothetical protein
MSQQPEPATGLARVDDVDAPMARSVRDVESLTPRERLARLDSTAAHYVNTQRPANMLKAYAQDWKVWQDYTTDLDIPLLSGTVGALTGFVVWLERGRLLRPAERADPAVDERADPAAPATIERSLIGAIAGLRDHHVHIGPDTSRAAWQALKGYRQRLAQAGATRGRGKAAMVTLPDLRSIVVAGMSRYRYLKCE